MADQRDDIIKFIRDNGPVLPVQISKFVNTNILFASAMLSELVDRKLLKITHAAIGGSPLYYLVGQEELIDERLSKSLGGKEKEAYLFIKEKRVVREANLEPWQRVAIKSLTDFAKPLNVSIENNTEVFWKYHLVTDQESQFFINEIINEIKSTEKVSQQPIKVQQPQQVIEQTQMQQPKPQQKYEIPQEQEEYEEQEIQDEPKIDLRTQEQSWKQNINLKEDSFEDETIRRLKKLKPKKEIKKLNKVNEFYTKTVNYLLKNNINILKEEIIKSEKEYDFIVEMPSSLGVFRYFLKAKSKPLINEADVSMAYSDGKVKNLPAIFLINGKINKKARVLIDNKFKGQLILKEI